MCVGGVPTPTHPPSGINDIHNSMYEFFSPRWGGGGGGRKDSNISTCVWPSFLTLTASICSNIQNISLNWIYGHL